MYTHLVLSKKVLYCTDAHVGEFLRSWRTRHLSGTQIACMKVYLGALDSSRRMPQVLIFIFGK